MLAGLVAGGALQSATGFGFALIASPVLVGAYGGAAGISALTLVSIGVNVLTLATERRPLAGDWPRAALLVGCYLPGAALGALVLRVADPGLLDVLVAGSVLLAVASRLLPDGRQVVLPAAPAGLVAGTFGMATGVSGPPLLLHLLHRGASPERTRDTLAAIFLATGVLGLGILALAGVLELPDAIGLLFLAVAVGHVLGRRLFARMGPTAYERVVLATMAASALASLVLVAT